MTAKQRDAIFQRWSGEILREARDLASLESVGSRAENDSDVRDDATLQSMIRSALEQRRGKLEQDLQGRTSSKPPSNPLPTSTSELPKSVPSATPEQTRATFQKLSQTLCSSLERGEDGETIALFEKLRTLQAEGQGIIQASSIADCERRVAELRTHLQHLRDEIAALTQQGVAAARSGNEQILARSMCRLVAIQAAHPVLLTEPQLDVIRAAAARAVDERSQHQSTTRKLLEREKAIADKIKKLAGSVHAFHQVACSAPKNSDKFREAEDAYYRAMREFQSYDTDWFLGVVLELADLLAEWTLPPVEAAGQIERFLDGIHAGVERIRTEVREIERKRESRQNDTTASAAP